MATPRGMARVGRKPRRAFADYTARQLLHAANIKIDELDAELVRLRGEVAALAERRVVLAASVKVDA